MAFKIFQGRISIVFPITQFFPNVVPLALISDGLANFANSNGYTCPKNEDVYLPGEKVRINIKSNQFRSFLACLLTISVLGWGYVSINRSIDDQGSQAIRPSTTQTDQEFDQPSSNSTISELEKHPSTTRHNSIVDPTSEQELKILETIVSNANRIKPIHSISFSQTELEVLRDLPNICTTDLPGVDLPGYTDAHQNNSIPDHSHINFANHLETHGKVTDFAGVSQVDYETPVLENGPAPTPASGPINRLARLPDATPKSHPPSTNVNSPNRYSTLPSDKTESPTLALPVNASPQIASNFEMNGGVKTPLIAQLPTQLYSQPSFDTDPSFDIKQTHQPAAPRSLEQLAMATDQNINRQKTELGFNPHSGATDLATTMQFPPGVDPHADVFSDTPFPSAVECAQCHKQIFEEWSSSSHAYASISPMFHRFEDTINKLSQGTIGYFCMRCHAPVATTMGMRRDQPIFDGPRVFREGVTCVACHRVKNAYTKPNGERRIEPGDIFDPVYGGKASDGSGVATMIKYKDYFKVKTDRNETGPGQPIHNRSIQFEELSKSEFCMSCHQVAVQPGIKLEVVWDQYRGSPAYREGITCQDCHMGRVPGVNAGYTFGPAAVVNDKVVNPERKHSNHVFYGPGYSIAHPGIFPHNPKADRWKVDQWLEFDWRAGWGTDNFEDAVADGHITPYFPPDWVEVDDRYDAREILDENLKKLVYKKDLRRQVMENGSKIDGPFFNCEPQSNQPLKFNFVVSNLNPGHNMPSGSLGAQPQLWLNVVLIGPDGSHLWESGDLDSWGDLRDLHSADVVQRKIPLDKQLFNLQTKFLTTNAKGTDREMFLPINLDFDQLPFLRPAIQPVTVLNHPPNIRMESHSIPPLGARKAKYVVPAEKLQMPGTYRLSFRLRSRAEPIYFMRFVAASPEMIRMMNEWIVDAHSRSVVFEVK